VTELLVSNRDNWQPEGILYSGCLGPVWITGGLPLMLDWRKHGIAGGYIIKVSQGSRLGGQWILIRTIVRYQLRKVYKNQLAHLHKYALGVPTVQDSNPDSHRLHTQYSTTEHCRYPSIRVYLAKAGLTMYSCQIFAWMSMHIYCSSSVTHINWWSGIR